MDNILYLSERAKAARSSFLQMRRMGAKPDILALFGERYIVAVEKWHKAAKPGKPFRRPSIGYLTRAL